MNKTKVTIIGSGNVATHLAKLFFNNNFDIDYVYSRNKENANALAKTVNATPITNTKNLNTNSDLLVIAIKDSAIANFAKNISKYKGLVVHTAGSIPISALNMFENYGILYPFQTLSKTVNVQTEIPFCIEANNKDSLSKLSSFAKKISNNVVELNSEQRKQCHLAGVFACNFTNYFYTVADELLSKKNIPFDVIKPLILETALKATSTNPKQAQTGPALRNDKVVIDAHIKQLQTEELEKLYSFVSDAIINFYKDKHNKN